MQLTPQTNPIIHDARTIAVRLEDLAQPVQIVRPRRDVKTERLLLWRKQSAEIAVEGLTKENEIFGLTKGQFSLLDLLKAVVAKTGPCSMDLSTWTASRKESLELGEMQRAGTLTAVRWLVDLTFVRRDPEAAAAIRADFGAEAIRVAHVHAKFALFYNAEWSLVLRTSMNLNMNPRTEDFTLSNDPELFAFLHDVMNRIWKLQRRSLAEAKPKEVSKFFQETLAL